jgi:lipopolysaccharide/colanic/teichoic acid biosynthesis glycosyltransferase
MAADGLQAGPDGLSAARRAPRPGPSGLSDADTPDADTLPAASSATALLPATSLPAGGPPAGGTSPARRAADVALVLLLTPLALPLFLLLALLVRLIDGAPVLHVAERMRTPEHAFRLYKLRSMHPAPPGAAPAAGVLGGDRGGQVTALGRLLRRSRLDELPQLWNILRGDMGFVGPRPPERLYVERCPELYARVLQRRPGLTGLATLVFHSHEERLLAACRTAAETDAVYMRRCVPRKARLDLIWARRSTPCGDLWLLGRTFARVLGAGRNTGRSTDRSTGRHRRRLPR